MSAKGIRKALKVGLAGAQKEIRGNRESGGHVAAGLSAEGYAGGYAAALMDVQLLLSGVTPNTRNYWEALRIKASTPSASKGGKS